jgi:broad specificity phosphatase PhoE
MDMRHVLAGVRTVLVLAAVLLPAVPAHAQRAVFLVRHAERLDASKDSPLSAAGEKRAAALADMLADAGITAIYTTEYQRTIKTAEPLALRLKLQPVRTGTGTDEVVSRMKQEQPASVVLVVGHSNTVPAILKALGVTDPITIADDEYSNLFIVTPREGGGATLVRLRF